MTSWRDPILAHFTPEIAAVARLTIVADPDQLLMEQGILDGVRKRGFEILTFDDHAAFRYAYEKRFRRIWDGGKATKLVVVLRAPTAELDGLPYDLLQEAKRESRVLSFSVAELFPSLQPHALADLDRGDFQALHVALEGRPATPLGLNATRKFLLERVFEVDPEHIQTPSDLLRVLLRRHHSGRAFPASLDEHLIGLLKASGRWSAWPLDQIVSSRADFFGFLQERWSVFVKRNHPVQPGTAAVIRPELPRRAWGMEEGALFAWVPTLTSVSRQSIFATEPPFFFAPSIGTTGKEEQHWSRFWEDQGLRRNEIAYLCQKSQEPDDTLVERVRAHAEDPRCRALAVVVGTVDEMLHGMPTGTSGMHASVRHWAKRGSLSPLIRMLLTADFEVSLTADHGNIGALGIGKPDVGETAEQRGERAYVFRDDRTRESVAARYPGTLPWPAIGLPDDYLPLIAPARRAFIHQGKHTVAHGGVCMEEVIVPFVRLARTP